MRTIKSTKYLILLTIVSLSHTGCKEVLDNTDPVVRSEDVIYISGETVRLAGRILSLPASGADDKGFLISSDENFISPLKVSSGPADLPGRYITEYGKLRIGSPYYARSYLDIGGKITYGNTITFTTLVPFISDYGPQFGFEGLTVTIKGGNFTSDTQVFFSGNEAEIEKINFESIITLRAPGITTQNLVEVKVTVQGKEMIFDQPFEYVIGLWKLESYFPDQTELSHPVSFVIGNELFIGLGREYLTGDNLKFWKVDLDTWNWSSQSYLGAKSRSSFFGPGYFGGGIYELSGFQGSWVPNNEFWIYDEISGEFHQESLLPFQLAGAQTIQMAGGFYLVGGSKQNMAPNYTIYYFDFGTRVWSTIKEAPRDFTSRVIYFDFQEDLYFFEDNVLYKFDIEQNVTEFISVYPGSGGSNGIANVIGDRVYIGLFDRSREIFQYDFIYRAWTRKVFFTGWPQEITVASWVYDYKIYVMRTALTNFSPGDQMEIWTFEPEKF